MMSLLLARELAGPRLIKMGLIEL
ncbi:hypothetical protein CHELA41_24495 [Hyphomicrobiales bacterium]|nr:hypothetical protein CHELA41_24495 [Hyphomicrobiales bacterium]